MASARSSMDFGEQSFGLTMFSGVKSSPVFNGWSLFLVGP
jgi:hypothetical protein